VQPRALTQPLTSYLGGNNIHVRTPCACVLLRDRLYGFCFCSFPAFPMKSRRSIHGEGRSTARSPPTQEAEALEITLPKSTAETAAEEGYQWPAVGESKAHVLSMRRLHGSLRRSTASHHVGGRGRASCLSCRDSVLWKEPYESKRRGPPAQIDWNRDTCFTYLSRPQRAPRASAQHTILHPLAHHLAALTGGVVPFKPLWLVVVL